uniref:ShKT domain-containing protein n=1 Tax=Syphacia muris TaxID=451379 RepID=A0A158R479_9BILA
VCELTTFLAEQCVDRDHNCYDWVLSDRNLCRSIEYINNSCKKSCGLCNQGNKIEKSIPLSWLVGKWRSEHGGKAFFPTMPKFTYGEQIEFSLPSTNMKGIKSLNYTAFAWSVNEMVTLHSENGFLTIKPGTNIASLTTTMDNGFVTVEEGPIRHNKLELHLHNIGRISFSLHDVSIINIQILKRMLRVWTLIDSRTLQSRLEMETLTHPMQEHTSIRYTRIYP